MSRRFLKVQAFVVASTLSIAMLLFAAQRREPATGPQFRSVVDLSSSTQPNLSSTTTLVAPAKLGGAWTLETLPTSRLIAPVAVIEAQHKNFPESESMVTMDDVAGYERVYGAVPQGAIVMITSTKRVNPLFGSDALHFLVEARHIVGIGTAGTEVVRANENPYLAKKGIYELNNIANLSLLPHAGGVAVAAPQKIAGATEGAVRLMAMLR